MSGEMLMGLEHPASVHRALLQPVALGQVMLTRCGRAALWQMLQPWQQILEGASCAPVPS